MIFYPIKNTLSEQIKRHFGARIIVCLLVYLMVLVVLTIYDFSRGISQLNKTMNVISKELGEYIISQVLISNEESAAVKLNALSKVHNITITWNHGSEAEPHFTKWVPPFNWSYVSKITSLDKREFGSLVFRGSFLNDKEFLYEMSIRITFLLLFLVMMLIILYPLSVKIPKALFLDPLMSILSLLKKDLDTESVEDHKMPIAELEEIKNRIVELVNDAKIKSHDAAIGKITAQVAHDIRSPLAILNTVLNLLPQVETKQQMLVNHSLKRINTIANNLLNKNKDELLYHVEMDAIDVKDELIYSLINDIVFEKIAEFNHEVMIKLDCSEDAKFLRVKINKDIFSRVISNILNNAIESLSAPRIGEIKVLLTNDSENISIFIIDNGCGIPESFKYKIFQYRSSHGKQGGTGLGLYSSKLNVEAWGGKIQINSVENQGTEVQITLPLSTIDTRIEISAESDVNNDIAELELLPKNDVSKISFHSLHEHLDLIFIDNDESLCNAWQMKADFSDKKILCFNSVNEFQLRMSSISKNTPIYIDSDLGNNLLGEYEAKKLYDSGYKMIFLSTGKNKNSIIKPDWILDIVGKAPPF